MKDALTALADHLQSQAEEELGRVALPVPDGEITGRGGRVLKEALRK